MSNVASFSHVLEHVIRMNLRLALHPDAVARMSMQAELQATAPRQAAGRDASERATATSDQLSAAVADEPRERRAIEFDT
jgi:hypothetical protein